METASRVIQWNVEHPANTVVMYLLLAVSSVICAWGLWRRVELWAAGRDDARLFKDFGRRFALAWEQIFKQKKTNSECEPALFHTLIYTGFLVLLFTTTMVLIEHDFGIPIYRGRFYLAITLLSDIFGILFLIGVLIAFHRRYLLTPDRLHNTNADFFFLFLLVALIVQGFMLEGLRIYVTNDPWANYSPVGLLVAKLCWMLPVEGAKWLHYITWWVHTVSVFAGLALLPYSKLFHLFSSSANLFYQELDRPRGALRNPGDIEELMTEALEGDGEFRIGVSKSTDLSWKQRMELDSCTSCGRCQDVCPAYNSGKVLSPKWVVLDNRDHLLQLHLKENSSQQGFRYEFPLFRALDRLDKLLLNLLILPDDVKRARNKLVQHEARLSVGQSEEAKLGGEVLNEDVYWSCTTCGACVEVCPVGIEHVDHITDVRRSLALMEGSLPGEAQPILKAIETRGNPLGPREERTDWAAGLDVRFLQEGDEVDVLYWVGCISAFDKRKQSIARSMVKILNASGYSWGILGEKECCTGDPARRMGEENLFQQMVKTNTPTIRSVKFKTLVANCPHCFNTLRNEYPQLSGSWDFEVVHHSHFIGELLRSGRIAAVNQEDLDITFHDPCYLGRYNKTYDEPREVLVQLGRTKLTEMKSNKERGLCCGAGGGHYWYDMKVGERVNVQRVDQAAETGAKTIATGCPFCLQMMEDGVKLTGREESLEVRDIAEIVASSLNG
jgi:Fe-S oxidoreductase/nitrate reductase gamma subunit